MGRHPPRVDPRALRDAIKERAVRILLECIIVHAGFSQPFLTKVMHKHEIEKVHFHLGITLSCTQKYQLKKI